MQWPKFFISYRREDTAAAAGRLYDRLLPRFGKDQLFMDVDTIEPGERFSDVVQRTVGSCDVLLALVGDRWLTVQDSTGQTRLSNPDDWVRLEVATALKRDIRVIPVLINGAIVPRRSDLPEDLSDLALRQAIDVTHAHFHTDVDRLLQTLDRVLSRQSPATSTATSQTNRVSSGGVPAVERKPEHSAEKNRVDKKLLALKIAVAAINLPLATLSGASVVTKWLDSMFPGYGVMSRLGICFGLVLIVWSAQEWRDLLKLRNLTFLAASIASADLAFWIGGKLSSSLHIWGVVILGAICLGLAQRFLLSVSSIQAVAAAIGAPLMFWAVLVGLDKLVPKNIVSDNFASSCMPLFWQIGYFLGMYGTARLKIKPFWKRS
jgi:hypothetical protein